MTRISETQVANENLLSVIESSTGGMIIVDNTGATPILVMPGRRDLSVMVDAIRNGSLKFIEKSAEISALIGRVYEAMTVEPRTSDTIIRSPERSFPGSELLTPREHEVLVLIASGAFNKEVGRSLNISMRTVEVHRAHIMKKLKAKNTADLMRIVLNSH